MRDLGAEERPGLGRGHAPGGALGRQQAQAQRQRAAAQAHGARHAATRALRYPLFGQLRSKRERLCDNYCSASFFFFFSVAILTKQNSPLAYIFLSRQVLQRPRTKVASGFANLPIRW